jgi:hypothetical protein
VRLACLLSVFAVTVVACQLDDEPDRAQPEPSRGGTILAIEKGQLLELDSRTFRPIPGRSAPIGPGFTGAAGISADASRVAVGGRRSIHVVDLETMKAVSDLPKPRGYASLVVWPRPGRLIVVNEVERREVVEALVLSARSGRILERRRLAARESWPFDVQSAGDAAVFLLHPVERIGPVRLVHFDMHGRLHVIRLDRIASGHEWVDGSDFVRDIWPALALDGREKRAFVTGSEELVAEVDLRTFRVEYHPLRQSVSLIDRFRNWLEPSAEAKAANWIRLGALWLGDGAMAVFGVHTVPLVEDGGLQERDEPLGFRLVDTEDWSVREIDEGAGWVERSGNLLLAYARLWDSETQDIRGIGLRAYTLDGERRFHALGDRAIAGVRELGDRAIAYLDDGDTGALVDLRTGGVTRELTRRDTPGWVLRVDGP